MSARTVHPFPARMAPEIALDAIPASTEKALIVLDPMCGSGTVLAAAMARGHRAVGFDIDPLAVLMSRVSVDAIDTVELQSVAARVVRRRASSDSPPPWGDDDETDDFVQYWFGDVQRQQLMSITRELRLLHDGPVKRALEVALSRIIVTKRPQASLAADTSHSRPHRVQLTSDYDVVAGFSRSVQQLARYLAARPPGRGAEVSLGDARLLVSLEKSAVDMAVTSPPYLNALDYLRGHKLALVWLGYRIADLRKRRSISIGSERDYRRPSSPAVVEMVEMVKADAADKSLLKVGMVERYAQDCIDFSVELARVVRPGGTAVLVVGNSTLRGNYIRNDLVATRAMSLAGFDLHRRYEREIPPNKRYMAFAPGGASSMDKRMRTEVVLTMKRQHG